MTATAEQIATVQILIPSDALLTEEEGGYGWSVDYIQNLMDTNSLGPAHAVRFFWLQRVNETAEYLDVGKPLTQIHRQAKEMLDYWDMILKLYGDSLTGIPGPPGPLDPGGVRKPLTFGEIERPYV